MHLIVIHNKKHFETAPALLQLALSSEMIADIALGKLAKSCRFQGNGRPIITIPQQWQIKTSHKKVRIFYYNGQLPPYRDSAKTGGWLVLSNGRFVTGQSRDPLDKILAGSVADLIAVNVAPEMISYHEKVLISSNGNIAGFCRMYADAAQPASIPENWPCHIFVRSAAADKVLIDCPLPESFKEFLVRCEQKSLKWCSIKIGGSVLDLETEAGLLSFLTSNPDSSNAFAESEISRDILDNYRSGKNCIISPGAKVFGKVVLGKNVSIDNGAVIIGPAIIGDNVNIAAQALVRASVIGPGIEIPKGCTIQNRVIPAGNPRGNHAWIERGKNAASPKIPESILIKSPTPAGNFRRWRWFSYPRLIKRTADIIVSLAVIILFAPIFPLIALAIKLTSKGPVFFADKRQGLHGKEFNCLKFRTMIAGADKIQERLRFKNEVDGPQFKVEDDPRVTVAGRFLRDTFIDEIPQFINILSGQMSLVGPRPSPKSENSQCPFWRDARISVRPGITGLWQIKRTRLSFRDFQEWIYYDTLYTKDISLTLDLWICLRTAGKLIVNFIERF